MKNAIIDEQPAQAPVSVKKWMGSFKLVMDECRPHDRVHFDSRLIDKTFEVLERVAQIFNVWRDKRCGCNGAT